MKKLMIALLGMGFISLACADNSTYINLNKNKIKCDNGHRVQKGSDEKDLLDSCKGYNDTSASNEEVRYDHLQGTMKKKGAGNQKQTVLLGCRFKKDSGDVDYKLSDCKYDNNYHN